jgi:hypothetical protein
MKTLVVDFDHRLEEMHSSPFDGTKATSIQDMNNQWNSERQSSEREGPVQECHGTLLENRSESAPQPGSGNDAAAGNLAGLMSKGIVGIKARGGKKGGG